MFVINWVLSAFVCGIARLLLNLAEALFSAGRIITDASKSLYRPLPRYEIEQILQKTRVPLLLAAIQTIRVGLRCNILPARFPLENCTPEEVADSPDDVLLHLYAEEIAGLLAPTRLIRRGLLHFLLKLLDGSDELLVPKPAPITTQWRAVPWPS